VPELPSNKADYGNWVSVRLLYIPGLTTILLATLSLVVPMLLAVALLPLLCFVYFAYARYRFSPQGGNIQVRIRDLVEGYLEWDGEGKVIDIGCGNAPLTISLAKKYHNAKITGVDYWGAAWGYSKDFCERNAEIEGVAMRVSFQRASASALPFDDESFDAAVSNLVFHEVKDARDKRDVIKEALRVVRKGGTFVFQDFFLRKRVYGEIDDLLETIKSWGVERVEFVKTSDSKIAPKRLQFLFRMGTMGILYGKK
jgi:ubiquinone/menaquinone biosynthesis C-methylase UbiE